MTEKIRFQKAYKKDYSIDGIHIGEIDSFSDYLTLGVYSFLLIISFPFWIIPYLMGRIIKLISSEKKVSNCEYECPNCKNMIRDGVGSLTRIECKDCGWYGHLDMIVEKEELKNENRRKVNEKTRTKI